MLKEVMINSVVSILVVLIGLAFAGVRQYLAAKGKELKVGMTAEQYATASKVAKTIVDAVEQVYQDVQGDERLKNALTELDAALREQGITLTPEQKRQLIEAGVYEMNRTKEAIVSTLPSQRRQKGDTGDHG